MLALARIDACFAARTNVMVGPLHLIRVKEVAQIGAGIGREFTYRLLAAVAPISGTALQLALEQLTRQKHSHSLWRTIWRKRGSPGQRANESSAHAEAIGHLNSLLARGIWCGD
jgi:hypothetical protein